MTFWNGSMPIPLFFGSGFVLTTHRSAFLCCQCGASLVMRLAKFFNGEIKLSSKKHIILSISAVKKRYLPFPAIITLLVCIFTSSAPCDYYLYLK